VPVAVGQRGIGGGQLAQGQLGKRRPGQADGLGDEIAQNRQQF